MAHHVANPIPAHLLMWQRVREYAVPPSMIEIATARRAVGDWAGACAAARVDTDLDLCAVRDRHGTELVTRVRADLRRLAPDLLRWHMPRIAPDGRLRHGLTISLARYRRSGAPPLQLVVRTPPAWADAGQRMSLALWEESGNGAPRHHPHPHPDRRFRLDLHRHLWDSGRSAELGSRCGEPVWRRGEAAWRCDAGAAPFLAPSDAAYDPARPSTPARPHVPDRPRTPARSDVPDVPDVPERSAVHDRSWAWERWAAEAELLLLAEGRPGGTFTVRLGTRSRAVLELVAPDDSHAPTFRPLREALPPQEVAALPMLPEAAARVLPDLELLRAGLIATDRLHPLVAAGLAAARSGPAAAPVPRPSDPHRVECRGEVHRIALRDGELTAIDHDPAQLRREGLLVALGGPALPCLRAIDAVHRDPEELPAVRERLGHGDVAGALAVVEALLGPGAVLRDGPLREELESAAARRIDHGLFRSGLVAAHPAAGGAEGANASAPGRPEPGHRPRQNRHTPPATRSKQSSRARPRTGLA